MCPTAVNKPLVFEVNGKLPGYIYPTGSFQSQSYDSTNMLELQIWEKSIYDEESPAQVKITTEFLPFLS